MADRAEIQSDINARFGRSAHGWRFRFVKTRTGEEGNSSDVQAQVRRPAPDANSVS
jgi:hypothetical protein